MTLYHLSETDLNNKTLTPRIPHNKFTENGYEEGKTARVCFAPTIDGAMMALTGDKTNKRYYVHTPVNEINPKYISHPTKHDVPDSHLTGEIWVLTPVKLKCIGIIETSYVTRDKPLTYRYGNTIGRIYKWNWKWVNKLSEVQQIYNELIGGSCYEN